MRRTIVLLALALTAGCGPGFTGALQVTFEVATPPPSGGGYRVKLLHPDGTPITGIEEGFAAARTGDQQVTLLLENADLYAGETAQVRVYAEALANENDDSSAALAIGSTVATVDKGGSPTATVRLVADPRPLTGVATARYASAAAGTPGTLVAATAPTAPDGITFVTWVQIGTEPAAQVALLAANSAGDGTLGEGPAGTQSLIDLTDTITVTLVAEPSDQPEQLAVPIGWPAFQGAMDTATAGQRDQLLPWLGAHPGTAGVADPAVDHGDTLVQTASNHSQLALSSTTADGKLQHSEHVFNLLAAPVDQRDFNDANLTVDTIGNDTNGLEHYLIDEATLTQKIEDLGLGDPALNLADPLIACRNNTHDTLTSVLAAATTAASGTVGVGPSTPELQTMVDEAGRLVGDRYADPAPDPTRQNFRCYRDRLETLTTFFLQPVTP